MGSQFQKEKYDILDYPKRNFLRLEAIDAEYGDDIHNPTGRSLFRFHKTGNSIGCVTAVTNEEWEQTRDLIRSTKSSDVKVQSKSSNPFAPRHEIIKKFGTMNVIKTKKEKD